MRGRFLAMLLALIWLAPVRAADPLAETAAKFYDGLIYERLPNGLVIIIKPIPGSPIVTSMMAYRVGSADEELDQTGLSHYLEHLMFKGTAKLMPGDIDRLTQQSGGRNNAYTTEDYTAYHFDFAADQWLTGLDIEAERMRGLVIDEKHEFEQEKGAVISELDGGEDEPWDLETKTIMPLLFGPKAPYGHPIIGEREHVQAANPEIIKRHYDRWYHPNNAVLVVVGGVNPPEAIKEIRKRFEKIPRGELPERRTVPPIPERKEIIRKEIVSKFEMPRLVMGFNGVKVGDPDDYVLDVISGLLTDGKMSRLHDRLIAAEGVASSVDSGNLAGRYPGWFALQVELIDPEQDRAAVEKMIFEEFEKLATKPITDAEMNRVRRRTLAASIFQQEDIHEAADRIAMSAVHFGDVRYAQHYLEKLTAVTVADVQRVTRKLLLDAKPVLVWSVPEKSCATMKQLPRPLNARTKLHKFHRDTAPKTAGVPFALDQAKRIVLPNGMTLLLLPNHRMPIVSLRCYVKDALLREPSRQVGVAALTGVLMEDGTPTRDAEEIADAIESAGGILDVGITSGGVKVLTPDTTLGFDLFFDCLFHSSFDQDAFDSKKELVLATIADDQQDPNSRARQTFERLVYGAHPFGRPPLGRANVIEKLTVQDCRSFHAAVVRPDNIVIAVVGDIDIDKVVKMIEDRSPAKPEKPMPPIKVSAPPVPDELVERIITDPQASQVHLYLGQIGIRRNDPDYHKLLVMDNVLGVGSGFTDRLSSNLRDRQGLAYTVTASITASADTEPGVFMAYMGTFPDKFLKAKAGLIEQIKRLRDAAPSEAEVSNAKKFVLGSLPFQYDTVEKMADELIMVEHFGLGLDYLKNYRAAVEAVTPADVQAVARKYIDPDKLTIVAAGPIDKEGKPLKVD